MKVLLVNTLYPPDIVGGAEKSCKLLVDALRGGGTEVAVAALHPGEESRTDVVDGSRVHRLPLDNHYWPFDPATPHSAASRLAWHLRDAWNPRAATRLAAVIDRERPDVVHTNNLTGFSVAAWRTARRAGLPIVHTLRDYSLLCRRATLFRRGRNCGRRCADCTLLSLPAFASSALPDVVVSNSRFVLDRHRSCGYFKGVPGDVIFNIMDELPKPVPRPRNGGPLTFGFIGKIDEDKGIEVVLGAVSRLSRPAWRLVVAGRGVDGYVARLKRDHPDPRIDWIGFANSADFYAQVDIVVVSSIWNEPLPRVMLEAMAYGRAVIASEAGGNVEIMNFTDLVGSYRADDVSALAALMQKALQDSPRGSRAPDGKALAQFAPAHVAGRYLAAYESARAGHDLKRR